MRALVAMAEYSRSTLKQLRPDLDFDYRHQETSIWRVRPAGSAEDTAR
ncbi:hypothetical protein QWA_18267 [Alcaligenes faecalis subsp. faecalis NCIB 8687]|nr:hypothetical protein QWA_18267 [Alcaligenes faecalis subsp. faecalis NCIB 8687]